MAIGVSCQRPAGMTASSPPTVLPQVKVFILLKMLRRGVRHESMADNEDMNWIMTLFVRLLHILMHDSPKEAASDKCAVG